MSPSVRARVCESLSSPGVLSSEVADGLALASRAARAALLEVLRSALISASFLALSALLIVFCGPLPGFFPPGAILVLRIGVQRGVWVGERVDDLNNPAERTVMSFAILPGKVEGVASQLMTTDQ